MEIKNDTHKHVGATSWHPITRKHKADLHNQDTSNVEVIEIPESVPDKLTSLVNYTPEPEESQGYESLVKKRIDFTISGNRLFDVDVTIPEDIEILYFHFGVTDDNSNAHAISNAAWQMVFTDNIKNGSANERIAVHNCSSLYFGRNNIKTVYISLDGNKLLMSSESGNFINLEIKY